MFAQAKTQPGVVGESNSNDGVRAVSKSGNGLSAFSASGTSMFAKGPATRGSRRQRCINRDAHRWRTAALRLIAHVQNLEARLESVEKKLSVQPPPSTTPAINVAQESGGFRVTGKGFIAGHVVTIRFVSAVSQFSTQISADRYRAFSALVKLAQCPTGTVVDFSATDSRPDRGDVTGVLWSNTVAVPCA